MRCDQAHPPTAAEDVGNGGVEGNGVSHARFVDQQQRLRADSVGPLRQWLLVGDGPGEPMQGVGLYAGGLPADNLCKLIVTPHQRRHDDDRRSRTPHTVHQV